MGRMSQKLLLFCLSSDGSDLFSEDPVYGHVKEHERRHEKEAGSIAELPYHLSHYDGTDGHPYPVYGLIHAHGCGFAVLRTAFYG